MRAPPSAEYATSERELQFHAWAPVQEGSLCLLAVLTQGLASATGSWDKVRSPAPPGRRKPWSWEQARWSLCSWPEASTVESLPCVGGRWRGGMVFIEISQPFLKTFYGFSSFANEEALNNCFVNNFPQFHVMLGIYLSHLVPFKTLTSSLIFCSWNMICLGVDVS